MCRTGNWRRQEASERASPRKREGLGRSVASEERGQRQRVRFCFFGLGVCLGDAITRPRAGRGWGKVARQRAGPGQRGGQVDRPELTAECATIGHHVPISLSLVVVSSDPSTLCACCHGESATVPTDRGKLMMLWLCH